jgi:hypothetical protein
MTFFNALLYIINAISLAAFGTGIWVYLSTKKKSPDEKKAGDDRPSV